MVGTHNKGSSARPRINVRLDSPAAERELEYWSEHSDLTKNGFIIRAIDEKISRLKRDDDETNILALRVNQLSDNVVANTASIDALHATVHDFARAMTLLFQDTADIFDYETDGDIAG